MYSSSTILVVTLGDGVNGFTLDPRTNEFVLSHRDVTIPSSGSSYSFNEGNAPQWDEPVVEYLDALKRGEGAQKRPYSSRYIGSMVADVHRTLLYGGIYGYPADAKNTNGKLRLLYEAAPMAFIVEQAGGKCTRGATRGCFHCQLLNSRVFERSHCVKKNAFTLRETLKRDEHLGPNRV